MDKHYLVNIVVHGNISTTHSDENEKTAREAIEEWFEKEIAPHLKAHLTITHREIQIKEI